MALAEGDDCFGRVCEEIVRSRDVAHYLISRRPPLFQIRPRITVRTQGCLLAWKFEILNALDEEHYHGDHSKRKIHQQRLCGGRGIGLPGSHDLILASMSTMAGSQNITVNFSGSRSRIRFYCFPTVREARGDLMWSTSWRRTRRVPRLSSI